MIQKILVTVLLLAIVSIFLFPKQIPGLLRRLGLSFGTAGKVGRELATGVEEPNSPLARAETQAGEAILTRLLSRSPPAEDPDLQASVAELGSRLVAHAERREIPYRFVAVESPEPNAFAVPGGAVLITRSLIHLCTGHPDLIAGVLAHEIQHIDRRHCLHQLTKSAAARTGSRLLRLGRGFLLGSATQAIEKLVVEGYRRDQEFEADLAGAALAAKAGFDPRGLARLLRELEKASPDGRGPLWSLLGYFRSHPPIGERIAALESRHGAAT